MGNVKVSVVVPIYNVEKYVKDCLESLKLQTIKDIEIIIINDGSNDKSDDIIRLHAEDDNRIRYIFRENRGVGATRNEGVAIATGEYITFVDPDDTIEVDMLKKMYDVAIAQNADIVECQYNIIKNDVKVSDDLCEIEGVLKVNISTNLNPFFQVYYYGNKKYGNHVWGKLFKTKIVKENNVIFGDLKNITGEDLFFALTILPYVDRIVFLGDKFYNYNVRENSIMNTYNKEIAVKTINFMKELETYSEKNEVVHLFDRFLSSYIYNLCIGTAIEFLRENRTNELANNLKIIVDEPIVEKYAKLITTNGTLFTNSKKKILTRLFGYLIVKKRQRSLFIVLYAYFKMARETK